MMTKERLIELDNKHWGQLKCCVEAIKVSAGFAPAMRDIDILTGYIINELLPAVRDNEEWKWDFKFWMEKYSDDFEEIHYANNRIFLDYELEYIREILKQEETK